MRRFFRRSTLLALTATLLCSPLPAPTASVFDSGTTSQEAAPARPYAFPAEMADPTSGVSPTPSGSRILVLTPSAPIGAWRLPERTLEIQASAGVAQSLTWLAAQSEPAPPPPDGWTLLASGAAAQWAETFLRPGARVAFDPERGQVIAQWTPAVYLRELDALNTETAARKGIGDASNAERLAREALSCRAALAEAAPDIQDPAGLSRQFLDQAQACWGVSRRAYYRTLASHPNEFRGAWLRPQFKGARSEQRD